MKQLLLALILVSACLGQPTYTQITDTVYTPVSGLPFNGVLQISNQVMTGTSSATIGQWLYSLNVVNGLVSIQLVPNDTAQPNGTTYAFKFTPSRGTPWTQYCNIPTSGSPIKLSSVCLLAIPPLPVLNAPVAITGDVGTGADTSEDTLMTYTLPGGRLTAGKYLKVTAGFTVSGNPSNVALYFGATRVCGQTGVATYSILTVLVVGISASSQKVSCDALLTGNTPTYINFTLPSETAAASILIKATGTNSAAFSNSVVQKYMIIEPGNF